MSSANYSSIYSDNTYDYRHVTVSSDKLIGKRGRLFKEDEWRELGVQMSKSGWEHYMLHRPNPNILLFRRPRLYHIAYLIDGKLQLNSKERYDIRYVSVPFRENEGILHPISTDLGTLSMRDVAIDLDIAFLDEKMCLIIVTTGTAKDRRDIPVAPGTRYVCLTNKGWFYEKGLVGKACQFTRFETPPPCYYFDHKLVTLQTPDEAKEVTESIGFVLERPSDLATLSYAVDVMIIRGQRLMAVLPLPPNTSLMAAFVAKPEPFDTLAVLSQGYLKKFKISEEAVVEECFPMIEHPI